jgi:uncharacterized glyoxalase superfamily protein PhnB
MAAMKRAAAAKKKKAPPIPRGCHTVTPYLIANDAAGLIEFVKKAFGGKELMRFGLPSGKVMHAEMKLGDSRLMIADPPGAPFPAMIHLYVENVDSVYKSAIKAGAQSIREPANQFYGDRSAGVKDSWGNTWWIATHIEDVSMEELQKRAKLSR